MLLWKMRLSHSGWVVCLLVASFAGCAEQPKPATKSPAPTESIEEKGEKNAIEAEVVTETPSESPATTETTENSPSEKVEETPVENPAEEPVANKTLILGDPSLTAGIPGEGAVTVDQVKAWLATPGINDPLEFELPLGLNLASNKITGVSENPLTRAKIELGRQLYFDGRLSADGSVSCATCHHPDQGFAAHTQFGVGINGQEGGRNSPVAYNRILSGAQFWDGRAASVEEQAKGPIANPIEMGNTHEAAVKTIDGIEGYRLQFEAVFGPDSVNIENVAKAIASFERVLVTGPSPYDYRAVLQPLVDQYKTEEDLAELKEEDPELYDRYVQLKKDADAHPMSEEAIRGQALFFSPKSNCTACHAGANFTDELYHNLGVGMDAEKPDLGRFELTKEEKDRGAFKTPTIRNVALTAPYMHDGTQKTLAEVVDWYAKGGHPNPQLSDRIKKLDLTDQDKADLVAFMEACTGEFPVVCRERLPQ